MTDDDMTPEEELARDAELKAMSALFDGAIATDISTAGIDFLARAKLLLDMGDLEAAKEAIHTPGGRVAVMREFDTLAEADRRALCQEVADHWAHAVAGAVRRLWHAAKVLGYQPDTIDPKMVALHAATLLGSEYTQPD